MALIKSVHICACRYKTSNSETRIYVIGNGGQSDRVKALKLSESRPVQSIFFDISGCKLRPFTNDFQHSAVINVYSNTDTYNH